MSIEALEGLTDEQLFSDANADEETTEQVVPEPAPEPEVQPENPEAEVVAAAETPAEKPVVDDNAAMVPSWRVREIREERDATAERLKALEAERVTWQRQQPATQPAKEPEKAAKPDPLLDPEGYEAYLETKFEEKLLNNHRESSLANAHKTYKGEFEEAYAAAQKQVDPALKARMQQSRDPGETLMEWHREQKTRAEVGTDLNAFRQREQERLLSDPAFLAKAIEKARANAQPSAQPGGKAPSPTSLPPSLTRATNASTITSADDDDISNDGLWRHANA